MLEKNLGQRMAIIGGVALIALLLLFRYENGEIKTNLRPGNDIAGGVSMIFEINTEGMEDYRGNLAEDMKRLLQRRVDPQGVFDLTWRVHGNNRIEVQMPLPPEDFTRLRESYFDTLDQIAEANIGRGDILQAVALPPDERTTQFAKLAADSERRLELLQQAAEQYEAYQAALSAYNAAEANLDSDPNAVAPERQRELQLAVRDADEYFEDAVAQILDTNFPLQRFKEVLSLDPGSEVRTASLKEWRAAPAFASIRDLINQAADLSDELKSKRTYIDSPADLQRLLRGAGVLTFRVLVEPNPDNVTKYDRLRDELAQRGPRAARGANEAWFRIDDPLNFFSDIDSPSDLDGRDPRDFEDSHQLVLGKYDGDWYVLARTDDAGVLAGDSKRSWNLQGVYADRDQTGRPCVRFRFDTVGGNLFGNLTERNVGKQLGIFLDDVVYSAPRIKTRIGKAGEITGDFSQSKVAYLIQTMQAGALPARLKDTPISERTLGSSLGQENLRKAFRAGVAGVIAVAIIMTAYYLFAGLIANAALCLNIVLVLAVMAMLGARINLAGIAGVILTIGMSVDANVLIFERMREEKARGSSLRMIIKNGYDKAFSTIIDANITTLLTCVILYYVGSEEVKGFGLTLGWGIVISLFTALFVTKAMFGVLLKFHLIQDVKMLKLIGVPNIDWYAKRKYFLPASLAVMAVGIILLYERGVDALDVEFRGGVSAEFELAQAQMTLPGADQEQTVDDIALDKAIETIVADVADDMARLGEATVVPVAGDPTLFRIVLPDVDADRLAALFVEPLEDAGLLARGGFDASALEGELAVRLRDGYSQEELETFIAEYALDAGKSVSQMANANISAVLETENESQQGLIWSITTTETNKRLVQYVLEEALGDNLRRQPAVSFQILGPNEEPYPVTARKLGEVIRDVPPAVAAQDVTHYLDGAAIYLDQLDPPLALATLEERIRGMRLQPDYQDVPWREFEAVGVEATGETNIDGEPTYRSAVVLVAPGDAPYSTDPEAWAVLLAEPEVDLVRDTLNTEQSLRKVSQFKPQIASQSQVKASLALLLSWAMIIGYLWLRFGRVTYGFAGVAALIHDVLIALAAVGISGWIGGHDHPIGEFFLIEDFHINMTIVAAFLTIIGYSINDTIVVFDRIRETRGRLGVVSPEVINGAINQCLSRTVMTSATTLIVLLTMYIFGGSSIRGFNYCMIIGVLTGTYSSIAVAAPLLLFGSRVAAQDQPTESPASA